jgi:hypothetical protein
MTATFSLEVSSLSKDDLFVMAVNKAQEITGHSNFEISSTAVRRDIELSFGPDGQPAGDWRSLYAIVVDKGEPDDT